METKINFSKKICFLFLILTIVVFIEGFDFIIVPQTMGYAKYFSRPAVICIGVISVLFSIASFFVMIITIRKIILKIPGLIINEKGFIDNTLFVGYGLIEWIDISKIDIIKIYGTKVLLIQVKDNKKYMDRIKSKINLYLAEQSIIRFGATITINAHLLNCSFAELEKTIRKYYKKYGSEPIT